jgi:hypothetical protein
MYLSRNSLVNNKSVKSAIAIAKRCCIAQIAFVWAAATPVQAVPDSVSVEQQVKDVVSHLVGVMDTSAQAVANPGAPNVRMTTCQVKVETANTH